MSISSPLRTRRKTNRPVGSDQPVILFCQQDYWFGLPMAAVKRVGEFNFAADTASGNQDFIVLDETEVPRLRADQLIFQKPPTGLGQSTIASNQAPPDCFLIVLETTDSKRYGLTISSPPKMYRVLQEMIVPFHSASTGHQSLQCVSGVATQSEAPQTIYLLDPDQLYAAH